MISLAEIRRTASGRKTDPSVIERAAIGNLNYVPREAVASERHDLPPAWTELRGALEEVTQPKSAVELSFHRRFAEQLAEQPIRQWLLLGLGSALVLVSMTFFHRRR